VLSGPAVERIKASALEEVVVTNTVPVPDTKREARVTVLSVASLLGEAIRRIHDEESVSTLFV
jgi:ribose-phosphate pyrophosphokinase